MQSAYLKCLIEVKIEGLESHKLANIKFEYINCVSLCIKCLAMWFSFHIGG